MKDYYKILGVSSRASLNEIKQAFKKLAKQYHPDKNAGNKFYEEKFKEINEAYQTLSDSSKKSKYDWYYAYQSTESYHSNYQSHNTSSQFRKSSAYSTGYTSHFYTNQEEEFSNTKSEKSRYTAWDNIKFYVISFALLVFIGTIGLLFGNFMNNYAADEHIKDGDKFYAAKLYIQAMNEYEAAIHFNDKDPRAYFGRANIKLNSQMDYVGAKYDYTTAIMLSDTINPVFLLQRAVCMYNLAQYRDAVYDLNSVLSFPEFADGRYYYFRGMCLVKSHNKEDACADFKKAFELKFQPAEDKIIEFCYYY